MEGTGGKDRRMDFHPGRNTQTWKAGREGRIQVARSAIAACEEYQIHAQPGHRPRRALRIPGGRRTGSGSYR